MSAYNKRRFVIEVKKLDYPLDDKTKTQAVAYANNQAIRWAILTNGVQWLIFDSFLQKAAHNRLVLKLSLGNDSVHLLAQYFERLLNRALWEHDDADVTLDKAARDIQARIELNAKLQPLAQRLTQLMEEFTVQNVEKALDLAERISIWNEEERALIKENRTRLVELASYSSVPLHESKPTSEGITLRADNALVAALIQGVERTEFQGRQTTPDFRVSLDGRQLPAANWRDVHMGIAEACLILNKLDLLEGLEQIYSDPNERIRQSGEPYPSHAYRQLSNGKHLFVHASAQEHLRRSRKLLRALNATAGILRVESKGETEEIP